MSTPIFSQNSTACVDVPDGTWTSVSLDFPHKEGRSFGFEERSEREGRISIIPALYSLSLSLSLLLSLSLSLSLPLSPAAVKARAAFLLSSVNGGVFQ